MSVQLGVEGSSSNANINSENCELKKLKVKSSPQLSDCHTGHDV